MDATQHGTQAPCSWCRQPVPTDGPINQPTKRIPPRAHVFSSTAPDCVSEHGKKKKATDMDADMDAGNQNLPQYPNPRNFIPVIR